MAEDDLSDMDIGEVTPEQFAQLVAVAEDEQIAETFDQLGARGVLDRVFEGMQQRFRPDRAEGLEADIQWVVTHQGDEHPYLVSIRDGTCTIDRNRGDDPRVTLTTDVVAFSKLVTGQAGGPALFMTGKLRVSGDLLFAQQILRFFDQPEA